MKLMPEIVTESRNDNCLTFDLRVPADLVHFDGHFPQAPVLPGVVQVDWVVRLARRHLPGLDSGYDISTLKFQALVRPNMFLTLCLDYDSSRHSLQFRYRDAQRICSSGRIRFERGA
ncbi:MAG: hypothetical protein RQ736_15195 [Thiogranum sp.]|nr:hypothetical protein [Thiogranum sp.]